MWTLLLALMPGWVGPAGGSGLRIWVCLGSSKVFHCGRSHVWTGQPSSEASSAPCSTCGAPLPPLSTWESWVQRGGRGMAGQVQVSPRHAHDNLNI